MKITPMMEQYLSAKSQYDDAILFFRMGDFYEMFYEDAVEASQAVGLTLTARHKGEAHEVPMAGVPHHAAEGYISKLISKGFKVAICEQLEDPKATKGLVKRGVTRVITPGTVLSPDNLDEKAHNFLAAVSVGQTKKGFGFGLAYVDASTGEFQATELSDISAVLGELTRVQPREVLWSADEATIFEDLRARLPQLSFRACPASDFDKETILGKIEAGDALADSHKVETAHWASRSTAEAYFQTVDQASFRHSEGVQKAVAGVLGYLIYTCRGVSAQITHLQVYQSDDFLMLDDSTRTNLELTETMMGGRRKGSLLSAIDYTVTAMGGRRLRNWLSYPLVNVVRIRRRHDAVSELKQSLDLRDRVRDFLKQTYDIERLTSKVTSGSANGRDLVQLKASLDVIPEIRGVLSDCRSDLLRIVGERLDPCEELRERIDAAIVEEPPAGVKDGGLIKKGFHPELDELIEISQDGKDWLLRYEATERKRTNITSLKVKYNKVFGYFLEVTKANLHLVPEDYMRKQTLTNSERYITPELKEYEEKVLSAEDRRIDLEYKLFEEVRAFAASQVVRLGHVAYLLSTLDVLGGLGELAHMHDYCRPTMTNGPSITIEEGRHPVVEQTLNDARFVPNNITLNREDAQLLLITGPNMAGKSTVIRQVALVSLLAQMGSFVPAKSAELGVVDKIFSRVGASDNLAKGHSTFMVEMTETAHILQNATAHSLIILDEIGRGTATFDGLSIAWAVAEHLHNQVGAKTLFATHYHELTSLSDSLRGVQNWNIAVKEWKDNIVFLRKLLPGPANRSYGIQVGRLAGLPDTVVARAKTILAKLESQDHAARAHPASPPPASTLPEQDSVAGQLNLLQSPSAPPQVETTEAPSNALEDEIRGLALNTMTPLEALNTLFALQSKLP